MFIAQCSESRSRRQDTHKLTSFKRSSACAPRVLGFARCANIFLHARIRADCPHTPSEFTLCSAEQSIHAVMASIVARMSHPTALFKGFLIQLHQGSSFLKGPPARPCSEDLDAHAEGQAVAATLFLSERGVHGVNPLGCTQLVDDGWAAVAATLLVFLWGQRVATARSQLKACVFGGRGRWVDLRYGCHTSQT